MESLTLFKNNKERKLFFFIVLIFFLFNLYLEFLNYKKITDNEIYYTQGTILNIYHKSKYDTLKIKTKNFTFFTPYNKTTKAEIYQNINLYIITKEISFISYLKGFYTKSFDMNLYPSKLVNKQKIRNYIIYQHSNNDISSLYNALYLAAPLTNKIREFASKIGISHLIAISGFHLAVLSLILYVLIHFIYNKIHSKFWPYRNKRFDIMLFVCTILFSYMIFINIPPSLLRAFIMFVFALFLLRNNIKIISFETLFIISLFIIALFPKLLFSLSLWFSITGVFYIFLFIKYFSHLNKLVQFVIFNFWLYLAINPITHYFFATTALEQLYSPIVTILFTIFYPLSIFLHILNIGGLFDLYLENVTNLNIYSVEVFTPSWFLILYIMISLFSIIKKEIFIVLNVLMILYNIWLFKFLF